MQQNFCQAADTGIGNSVIIGHFNLVLGGSSDVQPRRGGGMCLAGTHLHQGTFSYSKIKRCNHFTT